MSRAQLLFAVFASDVFDGLVRASLSTGAGVAGTLTLKNRCVFARDVSRVVAQQGVLMRIADAMSHTFTQERQDARIPANTLGEMAQLRDRGKAYAEA